MGSRRYQPETIINVLRYVRTQILQERLDGLEHVEALLSLRGDNLAPVPPKVRRPLGRVGVARLVLAALRGGPKTRAQIRRAIQAAHSLDHEHADTMAHNALQRLQRAGLVEMAVGGWRTIGAISPNR